jgi:putative hydrolase of the HAD superfamily
LKKINPVNLKDIRYWIFDLDNTLYPSESNLFSKIDERMKKFIMKNLSLDHEQAYRLQKKYYLDYGTTLNGLMLNHSINPINFLDYVHNINIDNIEPNFKLNNALKKLKGAKYVYTNSSENHAIRVLKKLNIFEHFNDIFDIEAANFIPKPKIESLHKFINYYKIEPIKAAFFEDISRNLINPKKIGFKTVLVLNKSHSDTKNKLFSLKEVERKYIDYIINDITKFLYKINLDINN